MQHRIGIQILSFGKPEYLKKTLDSIYEHKSDNDKVCVVEQTEDEDLKNKCLDICKPFKSIHIINLKKNLGQRGATNIVYESGFFNDTKYIMISDHDNIFHDKLEIYCNILDKYQDCWVSTGYNSPEHDIENKIDNLLLKSTARAGHMVLRTEDFLKLCPMDLEFGVTKPNYNCAWFCGLDWHITHWSPVSPGYKRSEFIYCYSGGVEHIGRESTWQGKYDDEYDLKTLNWFRNSSLYDIIKKYPPRHIYITDKYWYENMSETELKEKFNIKDDDKPKDVIDLFKDFLKINDLPENIIENLKSRIVEEKNNDLKIIAFNYIWPEYGIEFLENSIKSIISNVYEYHIFINFESYIGNIASESKINEVLSICEKNNLLNNIIIHTDKEDHSKSIEKGNILYYFERMIDIVKDYADYVWLVQSDEIYDVFSIEDVINICKNNEFEACAVVQPICYFDNPHWFINPPERFTRPTIVKVSNPDFDNKKEFKIEFHHCSYVLTKNDLDSKFKNWGHRNDVNLNRFYDIFDNIKTNKYIKNIHPVTPSIYHSVGFVDSLFNKNMFLEWVYYLMEHCKIKELADILLELSKDLSFKYPLSINQQKFFSSVISEMIPEKSLIVELGSSLGTNLFLANLISPKLKYTCFDDNKESYENSYKIVMKYNLRNMNIFYNTCKFLIPKLKNYTVDCTFINNIDDPKELSIRFIEMWPKMKDHGIMFGIYDSSNDEIVNKLNDLLVNNVNTSCPWGMEKFLFHEVYLHLFEDLENYKNINLETTTSIWFARVRKS